MAPLPPLLVVLLTLDDSVLRRASRPVQIADLLAEAAPRDVTRRQARAPSPRRALAPTQHRRRRGFASRRSAMEHRRLVDLFQAGTTTAPAALARPLRRRGRSGSVLAWAAAARRHSSAPPPPLETADEHGSGSARAPRPVVCVRRSRRACALAPRGPAFWNVAEASRRRLRRARCGASSWTPRSAARARARADRDARPISLRQRLAMLTRSSRAAAARTGHRRPLPRGDARRAASRKAWRHHASKSSRGRSSAAARRAVAAASRRRRWLRPFGRRRGLRCAQYVCSMPGSARREGTWRRSAARGRELVHAMPNALPSSAAGRRTTAGVAVVHSPPTASCHALMAGAPPPPSPRRTAPLARRARELAAAPRRARALGPSARQLLRRRSSRACRARRRGSPFDSSSSSSSSSPAVAAATSTWPSSVRP